MRSDARLLAIAGLAAAWVTLSAAPVAAVLGVPLERVLSRLVVLAVGAAVASEAWRVLRHARGSARVAAAIAASAFTLVAAIAAGAVTVSDGAPTPTGLHAGDSFGPLTAWPSVTLHTETLLVRVGAGHALLAAAGALVAGAAAVLVVERRACAPRRASAAAAAALVPAAACPACAPAFAPVAASVAGAGIVPFASALADPAGTARALLEVGGLLLAVVALRAAARRDAAASSPSGTARGVGVAALVGAPLAYAGLPSGASPTHDAIFDFFVVATLGAVALAVPVALALIYYSARYREGAAASAREPSRRARGVALAAFILVPAVVIFSVGASSYQTLVFLEEPPIGTLVVDVTGQRFNWTFTYPDGSSSAKRLVVPVDEVIVVRVGTRDVVHSFFVPDMGVKADALPGHRHEQWFRATTPGEFRVYCAEFCGARHTEMQAVVEVVPAGATLPYGRG